MKTLYHFSILILFLVSIITFSMSCNKEDTAICEVVVNSNGPAFLKVINDSDEEIFVDLTSSISLGAHTRSGACEIFGLPIGTHTIIIENEAETRSKVIDFALTADEETYTIIVDSGFF